LVIGISCSEVEDVMAREKLTIEVSTVNAAGARIALAAAEKLAAQKGLNVSIAIVDHAGYPVTLHRMDGGTVTSVEAATRKARTAAQLRMPSKRFQDLLHGGMTTLLSLEFLTPMAGGVPLAIDGVVVGGIGCSGGSEEDDEAAAVAGAEAFAAAAKG
jgi:glc operon protein GlcG